MKQETIQRIYMFAIMIGVTLGIAFIIHFTCKEEPLSADLSEISIAQDISDLETTIESDKQEDGKYKRRDKETINGIEYETHEYETSKGEIGYIIYMTKQEGNMIYKKAVATGVEQKDREFDWKLIKEIIEPTATSTE